MDLSQIVQEIQYTLAPAVMVSSAALLLLGSQNKFSNLFNRFRALNQERRNLEMNSSRRTQDQERLESVNGQLVRIGGRITFTKNAILFNYAAIVCFLVTSITIFLNIHAKVSLFKLTTMLFLTGLLFVLLGAFAMMFEIRIAYKILRLEEKT